MSGEMDGYWMTTSGRFNCFSRGQQKSSRKSIKKGFADFEVVSGAQDYLGQSVSLSAVN